MDEQVNYVKSFNWKQFFKIVAGVSFMGAGLAVITTFKEAPFAIIFSFVLIGIGIALFSID